MEEGRDFTEYKDYLQESLDKEIGRGIVVVLILLLVLFVLSNW
jgi:hypothetical protein